MSCLKVHPEETMKIRRNTAISWLVLVPVTALSCSGESDPSNGSTGGAPNVGGSTQGPTTGGSVGTGGATTVNGTALGGTANPGTSNVGGVTFTTTSNSVPQGGASTGGVSSASGGTGAITGGTKATGGTTATGGTKATGGTTATGGGSSCPFPTSFKWKDNGGPLAQPTSGWDSLKDFTNVVYNGQHIVYSSMHSGSSYGSQMMVFSDWPAMATATQTKMSTNTVAPTLFYFTPKSTWILAYQWGSAKFNYMTSTDPTKASSWSGSKALLTEDPTGGSSTGPIDQTVICDSTNCYLFFCGDNSNVYRASMPIGNFPGTFSGAKSIINDADAFEAVQVYTVKGTGQYLMIVETNGSPRSFVAYSASSLGGTFTKMSGTFAGKSNVTFTGTAWTSDISHGDLVRTNPDETQTVDPCNLQLLYQGRDPNVSAGYDARPYRPGLLTKTN